MAQSRNSRLWKGSRVHEGERGAVCCIAVMCHEWCCVVGSLWWRAAVAFILRTARDQTYEQVLTRRRAVSIGRLLFPNVWADEVFKRIAVCTATRHCQRFASGNDSLFVVCLFTRLNCWQVHVSQCLIFVVTELASPDEDRDWYFQPLYPLDY